MICSHMWIDPEDPPIARTSYAPWLGPRRRELKPGRRYICPRCGAVLVAPAGPIKSAPAPDSRGCGRPRFPATDAERQPLIDLAD